MSELVITISIRLPEGTTSSIDVGSRATDYGTVSTPARPASVPTAQPVAATTAAGWVCPEHGSEKIKQWPDGGISCGVKGGSNVNDKGYCRHRYSAPKPGQGPAQYVPPKDAPLDDLPFG